MPLQALRASLALQGPKNTTFLTHINLPETRLLPCDKPISLKEHKYYVIKKFFVVIQRTKYQRERIRIGTNRTYQGNMIHVLFLFESDSLN